MRATELESLLEWMSEDVWRSPSGSERQRALEIPGMVATAPEVKSQAPQLHASDVRASSTMIDDDRCLVGHSWEHIDVSLLVERHRDRQGLMSIEGRVWQLDRSPGESSVDVVWVHGDHVVDHKSVAADETFVFEGAPLRGWTLEFHVAGEPTVVVEDPGA